MAQIHAKKDNLNKLLNHRLHNLIQAAVTHIAKAMINSLQTLLR